METKMREQKKETKAQIERRIKNALVFVPKDKTAQSVYFSDKGLRLTTTDDYAIIETGFHRHVFDAYNTAQGLSRPHIYTKRVIEIALDVQDKIKDENGYSFAALLEVLKEKEDKSEYNIVVYYEWWLRIIFDGLYSIGEDEFNSWLVYFKYISTIATNHIILEEHKEDLTNKMFLKKHQELIKDFTENIDERVLIHAMSDEERMKENIEALQEREMNDAMEAQVNAGE